VECACCFDECLFLEMYQCPEGHLFCKSCISSQAKTALAMRNSVIKCMDASHCPTTFNAKTLQNCLDPKMYALWQDIIQEDALADLQGLENCPKCDLAVLCEDDLTKMPLLRCPRHECRFVSCRKCKMGDHTGRKCQKVVKGRSDLDEHKVEEAMSNALVRKCPKCRMAFVKSEGCGKCGTYSCYLCRKVVTSYDHFNRGGHPDDNSRKCSLWDDPIGGIEARHQAEARQAYIPLSSLTSQQVSEAERLARKKKRASSGNGSFRTWFSGLRRVDNKVSEFVSEVGY
ncbi:hypothetical protein C8J56DRAFT_768631, partial [Mycena floridula]